MDKISFKHLFFIICSSSIVSLKTYPGIFMRDAGRDSFVAVIISSLIIVICFDQMIRIWIKKNCINLSQVFEGALGKFLGKTCLIIFAFMIFLTMIECAAVETSVIHTSLFIESPQWYILLFIVLPGLYIIKKGKNAVIIVIIISMFISIINGINLYILTSPFKKYRRMLPLFANGIDIDFFIAILKSLGLYTSAMISLVYLKEVKNTKGLRGCTLLSTIFIAQMIIISTNGILATFNIERANLIAYPKLIQTQLISYFGFIASGEFYVIFQVLAGWFAKYIVTFFALISILEELKIGKIFNMNILPYSITGLVYVAAYGASNNLLDLFRILNYYSYISLIGYLIIPLIVFSIFAIRFRNRKLNNKN